MLFEGTEKKLEISFYPEGPNLLRLPESLWVDVVRSARAEILSKTESPLCRAYLLSESSLFVFTNRIVMITCGQTDLVNAVQRLGEATDMGHWASLIYERKNHLYPELQRTHIFDDLRRLSHLFPGRAFRFGDAGDQNICVFQMDRPFAPEGQDSTLEILMHGIDPASSELFCHGHHRSREAIHTQTGIHTLLNDEMGSFQVDDWVFEPVGYSLNAIRGDDYYTFHVTPEELGSYVSFETNVCLDSPSRVNDIATRVTNIFKPSSFDILRFEPKAHALGYCGKNYQVRGTFEQVLSNGYHVSLTQAFREELPVRSACEIPMGLVRKGEQKGEEDERQHQSQSS